MEHRGDGVEHQGRAYQGKQLLRPDEAAESLRVSRATIYRLCDAGELEAIRVGGSLRIHSRSVERILLGRG